MTTITKKNAINKEVLINKRSFVYIKKGLLSIKKGLFTNKRICSNRRKVFLHT